MTSLATRELDGPLVTAEQAKNLWKEYQALEEAILTEDDYMWFCEFQEWDNGHPPRLRIRKYTFGTKAQAEAEMARHDGAIVKKRKVKSATRKMGKYFALEMPIEEEIGTGEVELKQEAGFIIQIERSKFYTLTVWMTDQLETVKASCTVTVRSPSGRTWLGHGGSHRKEGREDFAISETAFTRALNRAILDFVGFGEESAEETPASEPVPGDQPPPQQAPQQPAQPAAAQTKAPTAAQQRMAAKRQEIIKVAGDKGITQDFMKATISNTFKKERLADLTSNMLDKLLKTVQEAKAPEPAQATAPATPESPVAPPATEPTQSAPTNGAAPESQPAAQDSADAEAAGPVVDGTARLLDDVDDPDAGGAQDGAKVQQWAQAHSLTDGEMQVILGMNLVRYFEADHSDLDAIMALDEWCRAHRPEYPCGDVECICTQSGMDPGPPADENPADPDVDDLPY